MNNSIKLSIVIIAAITIAMKLYIDKTIYNNIYFQGVQ